MSEQQSQATVQVKITCPHLEAEGKRWGDPISEERQAELQGYLDRWALETDHKTRVGPFDSEPGKLHVKLSAADIFWLAERSGYDPINGDAPELHLEGADLFQVHAEGALLSSAHLERTFLGGAHLELARLANADLERANLRGAHLEGTVLGGAHMRGTDLRNTKMDKDTWLYGAVLDHAFLDQLSFNGANLAVVNWLSVTMLGDEAEARATTDWQRKRKGRQTRLNEFEAAVRAHRQLAVVLRNQGITYQAGRFAYRAQVLQRRVLRLRRRYGAAIGSWLLDLISGYGYKPMRSFITYVIVICAFAGAYLLNAQFAAPHLTWDEALVLSISAFHGRGFFTSGISLGDTLARLAAGEAIIGLLIEITFIATFTQRFFAQ